jgi:cytochrome bd-type quinol oxidase subunit 2
MDPKLLTPWLLTAFVIFIVYRRVRRNFGRQRVSEVRLKLRAVVLAVIGALILIGSVSHPLMLGALAGGVVAGIGLAMVGLHHTQFEATTEGRFYIPHTYTGLLVTGLFLGRICYRFILVYQQAQAGVAQDQDPFAYLQHSPVTTLVFGLLIGYYIFFNVGILRRSQQLVVPPAAPAAPATAPTPSN